MMTRLLFLSLFFLAALSQGAEEAHTEASGPSYDYYLEMIFVVIDVPVPGYSSLVERFYYPLELAVVKVMRSISTSLDEDEKSFISYFTASSMEEQADQLSLFEEILDSSDEFSDKLSNAVEDTHNHHNNHHNHHSSSSSEDTTKMVIAFQAILCFVVLLFSVVCVCLYGIVRCRMMNRQQLEGEYAPTKLTYVALEPLVI